MRFTASVSTAMAGEGAVVCSLSHGIQNTSRHVKTDLHGVHQPFDVTGWYEPSMLFRAHQLRNARHEGANNGPPQRHGLHNYHRKPLCKAWQHKCARCQDFIAHLLRTDPTRYAYPSLQVKCVMSASIAPRISPSPANTSSKFTPLAASW